jgi:hypothetical protein
MPTIQKGTTLWEENPLIAVQTHASKKQTLCCACCFSFLGDWESQALLQAGFRRNGFRESLQFKAFPCPNPHCLDIFCSRACCLKSCQYGHLLECGLPLTLISSLVQRMSQNLPTDDVEVAADNCNYANEFKKHSLSSKEIYLSVRKLITMLCSACRDMERPSPLVMNELISDFLSAFPSIKVSHSSIDESDEHQQTSEYSDHESWLLLYSQLVHQGLDSNAFAPLLSFTFFTQVVSVLDVYLRSVKIPYVIRTNEVVTESYHTPLQHALSVACSTGDGVDFVSSEIPTTMNPSSPSLSHTARRLFPSLFDSSSPSVYPPTCKYSRASLLQASRSLALLSALHSDTSSPSSSLSASEPMSTDLKEAVADVIDSGSCVCMVLCTALSDHRLKMSCIPSAHYSASLLPQCSAHTTEQMSKLTSLPSSTNLVIRLVAIRDFICRCPAPLHPLTPPQPLDAVSLCSGTCCTDGLSLSFIPDQLSLDQHRRHRALRDLHLNHSSCDCVRCCIEERGLHSWPEISTGLIGEIDWAHALRDESITKSLLALSYQYMQISRADLAQNLLIPVIVKVEELYNLYRANESVQTNVSSWEMDEFAGRIYHVLGASYLEAG